MSPAAAIEAARAEIEAIVLAAAREACREAGWAGDAERAERAANVLRWLGEEAPSPCRHGADTGNEPGDAAREFAAFS